MTKARENSDYTGLQGDLALKSPVASPVFTGNVGVGAGTALSPLDVKSGFITVSKDAATAGRIGASAYITGSTDNDLIVQATGSGVTKLYQSGVNSLNIDAAGIVTKPLQPSFKVNGDNVTGNGSGFGVTPFNIDSGGNDKFDIGNNYNTTNYRFVAPVEGRYFFTANVRMDNMGGAYFRLLISKNGGDVTNDGVHSIVGNGMSTNYHTLNVSGIINCAANDYVQVKHYANNDTSWNLSLSESGFSGFLIG